MSRTWSVKRDIRDDFLEEVLRQLQAANHAIFAILPAGLTTAGAVFVVVSYQDGPPIQNDTKSAMTICVSGNLTRP